jgi:Ca2+ transporting ATPase
VQVGSKTECALLGLVAALDASYVEVRRENPETDFTRVYTFNSARKYMGTVVPSHAGGYRLYVKGASEIVLNKLVAGFRVLYLLLN